MQTCFFHRAVMRRSPTALSLGEPASMCRLCSTIGKQSWNITAHMIRAKFTRETHGYSWRRQMLDDDCWFGESSSLTECFILQSTASIPHRGCCGGVQSQLLQTGYKKHCLCSHRENCVEDVGISLCSFVKVLNIERGTFQLCAQTDLPTLSTHSVLLMVLIFSTVCLMQCLICCSWYCAIHLCTEMASQRFDGHQSDLCFYTDKPQTHLCLLGSFQDHRQRRTISCALWSYINSAAFDVTDMSCRSQIHTPHQHRCVSGAVNTSWRHLQFVLSLRCCLNTRMYV